MADVQYAEELNELMQLMGALGQEIGPTMGAFQRFHETGLADGAISKKMKELMALSIAISVRCEGCIMFHTYSAIKAGATTKEIAEAIGVALVMGGGPAMAYGTKALKAMQQFMAQNPQ